MHNISSLDPFSVVPPLAVEEEFSRHNVGGLDMKSLTLNVQRFLVSEDGPTAVEYAVMLALIVIVCLTAIRAVGTNANTTFQNIANALG